MTDDDRKALVVQYLKAFDRAGVTEDGGSILDLFADDAQVYFPKWGVARGREQIGQMFGDVGGTLKAIEHHYELFNWVFTGGDVLAAFAAGKIDAAELYPPAVDERQGLKDKIKLIYMPGWHQPETVLELFINKDRWEALSNHQRGLIQGACLATLQSTLAANAQLEADALAKIANAGVRLAPWPEDVLAALRSAWTEIANEEGDRDYFFRTVFDDIEKFRTKANSSSAPHASAEPEASAEAKAAP